jgi:hypothetical protein
MDKNADTNEGTVQDLSHLAEGSMPNFSSQCATSTVSATPLMQGGGSPSESVPDSLVRPEQPPVPPTAPRFLAGPGDKGGIVVGEGTNPAEGHGFAKASENAQRDAQSESARRWKSTRAQDRPGNGLNV